MREMDGVVDRPCVGIKGEDEERRDKRGNKVVQLRCSFCVCSKEREDAFPLRGRTKVLWCLLVRPASCLGREHLVVRAYFCEFSLHLCFWA